MARDSETLTINDFAFTKNLRIGRSADPADERGEIIFNKNLFVLSCSVSVNDVDRQITVSYKIKRNFDGAIIEQIESQVYSDDGRNEGGFENQAEYDAYISSTEEIKTLSETRKTQAAALRVLEKQLIDLVNGGGSKVEIEGKQAEIAAKRAEVKQTIDQIKAIQDQIDAAGGAVNLIPRIVKRFEDVRGQIDEAGGLSLGFVKTVAFANGVKLSEYL